MQIYLPSMQILRIFISREAEAKYVDFVTKLVPQWKEADNVEKLETTETDVSSSSSGFGIAVSKMSYE